MQPSEASGPSPGRHPVINYAAEKTASRRRTIFLLSLALHGLRIAFVLCLGILAARMIREGVFVSGLAAGVAAALILSGLVSHLADMRLAATEAVAANAILDRARLVLATMPAREGETKPRGRTITQLQRYPVAVARYCVSHWLAGINMSLIPLLIAGAIALVSWQAAVALILATPVMIFFFSLVGGLILEKAQAQEKALGRLATQFSDRMRTLPTILANHAFSREDAKLAQRMQHYASRTLSTLSVAFLNSAILDFFSALSIAMLAVFLGLGHLGLTQLPGFYDLTLWQSLAILVLAPEYFAPLRRYAEQYHLKAEGQAAAEALEWILAGTEKEGTARREAVPLPGAGIKNLVIRFVGAIPDFLLPDHGLVVLTGPSGSGKSMLLKTLAGVEQPVSGSCELPVPVAASISWVSGDTFIAGGSLEDVIGRGRTAEPAEIARIARRLGLLDQRYLPGGPKAHIAEGGENLSGGQRMRIALARGILGSGPLLCDEPTAKIDPHAAGQIRDTLVNAAQARLVIAATHDPALINMAQLRIDMTEASRARELVA